MPKNTPANVEHLQEYGPTPLDTLPTQFNVSDRRHGAARLAFRSGKGGSRSIGGKLTLVAYLPDDHDAERVVRVFLMANPQLLDTLTLSGLVQRFGGVSDEFQDAARRVLDETDVERTEREAQRHGGDQTGEWTCPLCGESMPNNDRVEHLTGHE